MALADGANFTRIMDCDGLPSDAATRDCLRGKSAADVLIHQRQFPQYDSISLSLALSLSLSRDTDMLSQSFE